MIMGGEPNMDTYLVYSLAGPDQTDSVGHLTWSLTVPSVSGINIWFQACQYSRVTNVVATSVQ